MKKSVFILLGAALLSVPIHGQDKGIAFQNTIKIEPGDSHEVIIEKAAHVVPTPNQLNLLLLSILGRIRLPGWSGGTAWKIRRCSI